jgi:isocitrate dehydrogenase kinase/phosphatase
VNAVVDHSSRDAALVELAASSIRDAFEGYNGHFRAITQRARGRFEQRDWHGARADAVERIELYDRCIAAMRARLQTQLEERAQDKALWAQIRRHYSQLIEPLLDQELYKTFFNTLTRRFFGTRGVDPEIEFVALSIEPTDRITRPAARRSYAVIRDLARPIEQVLEDFSFEVPYAQRAACAAAVARRLSQQLAHWQAPAVRGIELMQTVFYRERRAYLVGRVFGEDRFAPLILALMNTDDGIRVDAVITDRAQVAVLFGYTRSYFHADLETVGDAVVFLRTLLPHKPLDELYTVLGRAKQGKTERYRHFFAHLQRQQEERFVRAPGERGMVMAVFTLPSYPVVFKLIRDRFAYPKNIARAEVEQKYRLVFHHDRVGRLVDAQSFRHLRFPKRQFEASLLDELLRECAETVHDEGEDLVFNLCYIERRLRPLNLYLHEVAPELGQAAIVDYGQAIKDLARSNIFPGDLLLKNFGMSRTGRAIFYDYDELCFVTDCRFRALPEARDNDEEMHAGAWFYVGDSDVFPEQFPRFLGLDGAQQEALLAAHGEIFTVAWWLELQKRIRSGELVDVPPYPARLRLDGAGA